MQYHYEYIKVKTKGGYVVKRYWVDGSMPINPVKDLDVFKKIYQHGPSNKIVQ